MRDTWGYIGYTALGFGSTVVGLAAAAGCSVGQGSPDGWRYLDRGTVAVAHPGSWHETGDGAVLRGRDGRTVAALTVTPGPAPGAAVQAGDRLAPGHVRREELRLDGHPAQVLSYVRPAPDGRPAGHIEVRTTDAAGHPVVISAWAVEGTAEGTADAPALLREIVNSLQFTPGRPR
jgi:hypothetical protein